MMMMMMMRLGGCLTGWATVSETIRTGDEIEPYATPAPEKRTAKPHVYGSLNVNTARTAGQFTQ